MVPLPQVQQHVGYCPQFDALIERMTGRELLTMFARLRGIPEHHIPRVVASTIKRLDIEKHADKLCGKYRYCLPTGAVHYVIARHAYTGLQRGFFSGGIAHMTFDL